MNQTTIQRITAELIMKNQFDLRLTTSKLSSLFVNKELIDYINKITANIKSIDSRELALTKIKKILIQVPRLPENRFLTIDQPEFAEFCLQIRLEQEAYNPLKWVQAELDLIRYIKYTNVIDIGITNSHEDLWIRKEQVLKKFDISTSTLNRWISEGMPCSKVGAKINFSVKGVNKWLEDRSATTC